jgi:hypothetical protein
MIYSEGIWSNLRIKLAAAQEMFRHKFNADIQIDFSQDWSDSLL